MRPGRSRLSSAIECVFQSSRISAYSSTSTGRRSSSRMRSDGHRARVHTTAAPLTRGFAATGRAEPLPGHDRRAVSSFACWSFHTPSRGSPAVARGRDRPQRLARLARVWWRGVGPAPVSRASTAQTSTATRTTMTTRPNMCSHYDTNTCSLSRRARQRLSSACRTTNVRRVRFASAANCTVTSTRRVVRPAAAATRSASAARNGDRAAALAPAAAQSADAHAHLARARPRPLRPAS